MFEFDNKEQFTNNINRILICIPQPVATFWKPAFARKVPNAART